MPDEGTGTEAGKQRKDVRELTKKLTAVGWGLFFIWLGIALLFDAEVGFILVGVGLITFIMQAARKYYGLESETFWIVVAVLFMVVGLWQILDLKLSLMAVLLIVVGAALLVSAAKGRRKGEEG
ncbi:MAG: hypothetical protein JSV26_00415 [bacterium]|nr:MAG: hypothetical protein JSV26_00415 [bacterium]